MMGFLRDLLTILKLFVFMVYSTSTTLVKNLVIPDSLLSKCVKNQIVLITGAGTLSKKSFTKISQMQISK